MLKLFLPFATGYLIAGAPLDCGMRCFEFLVGRETAACIPFPGMTSSGNKNENDRMKEMMRTNCNRAESVVKQIVADISVDVETEKIHLVLYVAYNLSLTTSIDELRECLPISECASASEKRPYLQIYGVFQTKKEMLIQVTPQVR